MVQKRSAAAGANDPKPKQGKAASPGPGKVGAVEDLFLAELLEPSRPRKGATREASNRRSAPAPASAPAPVVDRRLVCDQEGQRRRQAPTMSLEEAVVGYQRGAEDPTPIRLVAKGKELAQGEVFETQSDEIRKAFPQSPIAKVSRAKYNWVAETDGGRFTRDPTKMLPVARGGRTTKWTCDICGKQCSEQLFVFRAYLRKEHLRTAEERCLDRFVAYISYRCGRGLLGQLSEYARFKEEVFCLATRHTSLDEARCQLEESLKRCNREDQQFLVDELERLAGVGPGGAPKTVEMESVERIIPGPHPAVLLRSAEDVFRAMARTLAPRVGARLIAAATLAQLHQEGQEASGYLKSVLCSLDAGGPLPQVPLHWPLVEVETCLNAALRAINGQGDVPQVRVEVACSWDARMKAFGPSKADLTIRLGYLQARQALHAFVGGARPNREEAGLLQQRLEALSGDMQPVQSGSATSLPGMSLRPALRFMGRAESLGYGWHSADWAQRLKDLLNVQLDFTDRPLRLATGCSGAEAPHFALQQLVGHRGFEQMWGSEINENPRRFILKNCSCQHLFEDVCFVMKGGGRCARHGGHCTVPSGEIDIFIGGFPCTPYSFCNPKRFKRNCFTEPAAAPFFEMRKFIAERRPRLVILENVRGLLAPNPETDSSPIDFILRGRNPENPEDCYQGTAPNADWGLSLIEGYGLRWDILYSCDWGLPQSRPRVYIVMVRDDAGGQAAAEHVFEVLSACAGRMPRGSCNDFLFPDEHPQLVAATKHWASKPGPGSGRRACTKFTEALFRTKRQELGLDPKDRPYSGNRPAGWYPHATEKMVQQLDIIYSVAEKQGLDFNFLLADLSQQVSRGAWRDDGNIPTLTTGSLLYSFSQHRPFIGEECLRLNGFPIEQLNLDAHTEAERIFLAGNAMSVPVVGAVLFAALVSLSWGEMRTVSCGLLPEPMQKRPDVRKLAQPGSIVLARLGPSLADDDCEVSLTSGEDAQAAEDSAIARRAAVLLALTRELATEVHKRQKTNKEEKKGQKESGESSKSSGLAAVLQAAPSPPESSPSGDGTGWEMRYSKVLERLKAPREESLLPNDSLKKWLRESGDLLMGMDRDERNQSAKDLQQFVVKSLEVLQKGTEITQIVDLGLEDTLMQLCNLRFPEAKVLLGRVAVLKLQRKLSSKQEEDQDADTNWLDQAKQLKGTELCGARASLLKLLNSESCHGKLTRFLLPLLQSWHTEVAEDQELQQVFKGIEFLRKGWISDAEAWPGFAAVGGFRHCCLEIAKSCERRKRPKSSHSFRQLVQKLHGEMFLSRILAVLMMDNSSEAFKRFLTTMQDAIQEDEVMRFSSESAWKLLHSLFQILSTTAGRNLDFWPIPEELVEPTSCELVTFRRDHPEAPPGESPKEVLEKRLAGTVDHFLWRVAPTLAMRLHLDAFRKFGGDGNLSQVSFEHFLVWSTSKLNEMKFDGVSWTHIKQLDDRFSEWSQQLNLLQKNLNIGESEKGTMDVETYEQYRLAQSCCAQRVEEHGEWQAWLARLMVIEQLLKEHGQDSYLRFDQFRQALVDSMAATATPETINECMNKNQIKVQPHVLDVISYALQVELQVPSPWTRVTSSTGLYFFQNHQRVSSWTWPAEEFVHFLKAMRAAEPEVGAPMTPPMADLHVEEEELSVPVTPAIIREGIVIADELAPITVKQETTIWIPPSPPAGDDEDDDVFCLTPVNMAATPITPPPVALAPASQWAVPPPEPPQPPKFPSHPLQPPRTEPCQPSKLPSHPSEPPRGSKRPVSPERPPSKVPVSDNIPRAFSQGSKEKLPLRRLQPPPEPEWGPPSKRIREDEEHGATSAAAKMPKPPTNPPPLHLYGHQRPRCERGYQD